jgi:uncharacterized protein YbjT (DUF2867 family)
MKTLVIGGAGLVGSMVVEELVKRGADVRVFARKKSAVAGADKTGLEVIEGDLLDPATVENALDGVDKLYLLNAVVPDELTQGLIAYDLARKQRLQHVVYHSVFRAEHFLDVPHFASKVAVENALKAFDVPWTIIRPNYFFQNDSKLKDVIKGAGLYPMPLGSTGISMVDVRDIAEAAAASLMGGEVHHGRTYNVNGPDVLSGPAVAAIWSEVLGKDVRYGGHDMESFEAQMRKQAPAWSAFDLRMMMQGYLERGFTAEAGDLETLTALIGHPPRRYEDFARETAGKWAKELPWPLDKITGKL